MQHNCEPGPARVPVPRVPIPRLRGVRWVTKQLRFDTVIQAGFGSRKWLCWWSEQHVESHPEIPCEPQVRLDEQLCCVLRVPVAHRSAVKAVPTEGPA